MGYYNQQDSISFKQILLEHMKKILEISTHEFREGRMENKIGADGLTLPVYISDTRKSFIQSVETFTDILFPYFDKTMIEDYEEIMMRVEKNKDDYNTYGGERGEGTEAYTEYISKELNLMKKTFRVLNLLLHRIDYLKTAVFGDVADEVVVAEDTKDIGEEEEEKD